MADEQKAAGDYKTKRFRSPPYPFVPLGKAVERAKELYQQAQHHPVPLHVLASAWGYALKSSGLLQTAAALKQFGLLDDQGSGDKRRFRLTNDAIRIVTDPDQLSAKRTEAIKRAALAPKVHTYLWEKFGMAGVSGSMDVALKSFLTVDRRDSGEAPYSNSAAEEVISEYKETAIYAGLANSDIISGLGNGVPDSDNLKPPEKPGGKTFGSAKVGDLVQWEAGGELKLESAKRVRAIQKHDGVEWVFVDGSETGIPMTETIVEKKGEADEGGLKPPRLALSETKEPGVWKELTRLDTGDAVISLPEKFSADGFYDLEIWVESLLRKAARKAGVDYPTKKAQ
ncbi:MAG: hypothetical protein AB7P98_17745 [Parvularculaceae bacterium]